MVKRCLSNLGRLRSGHRAGELGLIATSAAPGCPELNGAPEDKKMGLMAAVLTKMAEQRITMDARMAEMDEAMMKHMMQHMQMGKEYMSQCPMMKGMKDMDEKSADAHKEHQEQVK